MTQFSHHAAGPRPVARRDAGSLLPQANRHGAPVVFLQSLYVYDSTPAVVERVRLRSFER